MKRAFTDGVPPPQAAFAFVRRTALRIVLLLQMCAVAATHAAQPYEPVRPDPLTESWRWRTFPELSGLGAHCMAESVDGTVWFGTVDGAWSYDGVTWVHHPADRVMVGGVNTLCPTPDGNLYIGGRAGISRFDHGQWIGLFPGTGGPFGEIRKLILARDGALWAASAWGVLRYHADRWTCYTDESIASRVRQDARLKFLHVELLPASVTNRSRASVPQIDRHDFADVAQDPSGRIWLGTDAGEIVTFDPVDGLWGLYNEADGLVCGRHPSILPLANGAVWVVYGAGSGHANVFDGGSWKSRRLADAGVPGDAGGVLQTRDGVIWLSSRYVISAYRDGHWRNYQQPEVPIPTARNFLHQSADGALWIGGPGTEIQRVDYETPRWLTLLDLIFQWESPAGASWFLHRDGRVVVQEQGEWTAYGGEDGVIDAPVALVGARDGTVWVAGSHQGTAATARFDGRQWTRFIHDEFSWGVDWHGVLATADGSVWFAAAVDSSGPKQHRHGLLQHRDGTWTHHHQPGRSPKNGNDANRAILLPATQRPEPVGKFLSLGESRDGRIWAGRNILVFQDGEKWSSFSPPSDSPHGIIETMLTTREGELWIGSRQYGALRYDGRGWQRHQGKDSLVANSVRALAQTADGSVWAATDRDVSRFDGSVWITTLLPRSMNVPQDGGSLKTGPSGALWINRFPPDWTRRAWPKATPPDPAAAFWTVRHDFRGIPPQTAIATRAEQVSPSGNLSVLWSGTSPWREARDSRLQFSFRLDEQPWSAYTTDRGHAFFSLAGGRHRLEVRARDQDFNVDPSPAILDFIVLPPVWRQGWFIALLALLGGLIVTQSIRVWLEQRRLRQAHDKLEERVLQRTAELESANRELEAFSYSVSHDLRAPLRAIDGFSQALLDDYRGRLDAEGDDFLRRIRAGAQRMGLLIEAMLGLSRVTRGPLRVSPVDLSALAAEIGRELTGREPSRPVELVIAPGMMAAGDPALLRIVLENLLGNAWKFTAGRTPARIEFGVTERDGRTAYFVRDNGAGFDRAAARQLFGPFQRFHTSHEFPGTGIGLATVQRIVQRHGGWVDAESQPDRGATFFFTLSGPTPRAS